MKDQTAIPFSIHYFLACLFFLLAAGIAGGQSDPAPDVFGEVSMRAHVGTGNNVLISGFMITGETPMRVLVRALAGSLGVREPLADPTLELYDGNGVLIIANNNWRDAQEADIQATGHAPGSDFESAALVTLAPTAYTLVVRGANNTTGVGMSDIIDEDSTTTSRLQNISSRAFVEPANRVMVGGFTISGTFPHKVMIRGLGPSLAANGIADALSNPTLLLRDTAGNPLVSTTIGKIPRRLKSRPAV
jgi:hypothetical protein